MCGTQQACCRFAGLWGPLSRMCNFKSQTSQLNNNNNSIPSALIACIAPPLGRSGSKSWRLVSHSCRCGPACPCCFCLYSCRCCFSTHHLPLQTQRQLQHSLEVHQRYIHSLMEQEGLAHRIPEMSAALASGPGAPPAHTGAAGAAAAAAGAAGGGVLAGPSSVVSEAMPAQPAAGSSLQHQQLGFETGATSSRAAAAVVQPSLAGSHAGGASSGAQQHQQHTGGQISGHRAAEQQSLHRLNQQQQQGADDFLLPHDLLHPPGQHGSMQAGGLTTAAAAAQAAAADSSDLLAMGAAAGGADDLGFLSDHDLHLMLGMTEDHDSLLQPPTDKRQRLLGPDDIQ